MPQAPDQFAVVLTFHDGDGQPCEAVLTPLEAAVLVSEIAGALKDGDCRASRPELAEEAD